MRELFASEQCINQGLFDSFQIQNPEGVQCSLYRGIMTIFSVCYPDLVPVGGRCEACWCCSKCSEKCQLESCCASESKDDIVMRVLGIDRNSENIKRARAFKRFVEREEGEYFSDDSEPEIGESDTDSE